MAQTEEMSQAGGSTSGYVPACGRLHGTAENGCVDLRELFLPMLGNWAGVEQHAGSPGAPATTARAMIVFKLDVGDQVVVQDYRQVRADRTEFCGHGVFMIDSDDRRRPILIRRSSGGSSTLLDIHRSQLGAAGEATS